MVDFDCCWWTWDGGERGPFGKAKWLFVVDVGGNLDDLVHRSWWWTWGGANGQVAFGS